MNPIRAYAILVIALALAACAPKRELSPVAEPLGDFKLGYNIVVVEKPEILPLSRQATDAEWKAALEKSINDRFSRFKGTGEYHVAIKLQAYALGAPGVPLVANPKSVILISASVWRPTGKINAEPENLTVWEGVDGNTLIGSGLTQSKEVQMERLAFNAALKIEEWMREHPDWFRPDGPINVPRTGPAQTVKPPGN